jgi:dissimilatory sulfite reductase (desulfoviridin) alpha/beta subunit
MRIRPEIIHMLEQKGGVIPELDNRFCTIRLRIPGGIISADQLLGIARHVRRRGIGNLHLTTRQTIEIPHVPLEKIPSLLKSLEKSGVSLGAEHEEVVNITACPGTDRCRLSNIETANFLTRLDSIHFGKEMPVRVRIAISACPNGCTSERLSEIGITGLRKPIRDEGLCTGCGTCAQTCKEKAVSMVNGRMILDSNLCVQCGMCIDSCPFHIIRGTVPHYMITVGGKRGRHPVVGRELIRVDSEDKAVEVVDRVVDWIYRFAYSETTLTDQLEKMKFSAFQKRIIQEFGNSNIEP